MRNRVWNLFDLKALAGHFSNEINIDTTISQEELNAYGDMCGISVNHIAKESAQQPGKTFLTIEVTPDTKVFYLFDIVAAVDVSKQKQLGDIFDDVTNSVEWLESLKWDDDWWKNAAELINVAILLNTCSEIQKEKFIVSTITNPARHLLKYVDADIQMLNVYDINEFVEKANVTKDYIAEMKAEIDEIKEKEVAEVKAMMDKISALQSDYKKGI